MTTEGGKTGVGTEGKGDTPKFNSCWFYRMRSAQSVVRSPDGDFDPAIQNKRNGTPIVFLIDLLRRFEWKDCHKTSCLKCGEAMSGGLYTTYHTGLVTRTGSFITPGGKSGGSPEPEENIPFLDFTIAFEDMYSCGSGGLIRKAIVDGMINCFSITSQHTRQQDSNLTQRLTMLAVGQVPCYCLPARYFYDIMNKDNRQHNGPARQPVYGVWGLEVFGKQ